MKTLISTFVLILSMNTFANDIFLMNKSFNPKNILHYKVGVVDCQLQDPTITPYWIMGEEDGHTEGLTKKEKAYFEPKISFSSYSEIDFTVGALEKLGNDLPNKKIMVRLIDCAPKAYMDIDDNDIELTNIYVNATILSVKSVTIHGLTINGEKFEKVIKN